MRRNPVPCTQQSNCSIHQIAMVTKEGGGGWWVVGGGGGGGRDEEGEGDDINLTRKQTSLDEIYNDEDLELALEAERKRNIGRMQNNPVRVITVPKNAQLMESLDGEVFILWSKRDICSDY